MSDDGFRYAITGDPVTQSLSPVIHSAFAKLTGQDGMRYGRLPLTREEFEDGCRRFFAAGGHGLNVTMPHKAAALALCDAASAAARRAGAVNTLIHAPDSKLYGENTDGPGLVNDLRHQGIALGGRSILLVGAGGAGRGVLDALLAARPAALTIANRTRARADDAARAFSKRGPVKAAGLADCGGPWDLVINATAASLYGELPGLPPSAVDSSACYDMAYAAGGTVFTTWARDHGAASVHTGVGMLIEQAALSFALWRGVRPPTQPVRDTLAGEHGLRF